MHVVEFASAVEVEVKLIAINTESDIMACMEGSKMLLIVQFGNTCLQSEWELKSSILFNTRLYKLELP